MSDESSPLAHPEWAAFVMAMQREPDDDTTRLVAADWLQDTGRPELTAWAEFIRLAMQPHPLLRLHVYSDSCDCYPCRIERRATMLFDRWGAFWLHHACPWDDIKLEPVGLGNYKNGFIDRLVGTSQIRRVKDQPAAVARLFERQPVARVEVGFYDPTSLLYVMYVSINRPLYTSAATDWVPVNKYLAVDSTVMPASQYSPLKSRMLVANRLSLESLLRTIRGSVRDSLTKRHRVMANP